MDTDLREELADVSHAVAKRLGLLKRPSIGKRVAAGMSAGAAGTTALNLATYLDMAARGRPASQAPAETVKKLEEKAGIQVPEPASNRRQALGALFGFVTGLGVGALYGLVRPSLRSVPVQIAGVGVGLAAMAGSDVPMTLLGVSDPKEWSPPDWLADLIPHLAYGFATAVVFDALTDPYD
jgi:hypothetical protein